jgi:lactate dehydrogenase-like 2-hydroxyacid dehydrogenase
MIQDSCIKSLKSTSKALSNITHTINTYHNRSRHEDAESELNASYVSFDTLLEESDFVVCTVSGVNGAVQTTKSLSSNNVSKDT